MSADVDDRARLKFEALARADLPMLQEWLGREHVKRWWASPSTLTEVEADYGPTLEPGSTTHAYIVWIDGEPAGFIQSYCAMGSGDGWWEDVTDAGVRGIDQFLAHAEHLRRGWGNAMVRSFVERLLLDPAVTRVQADPSPDNERAIRCYMRAGFRRQGVVDTPDGPALLMFRDRDAGQA